MRRAGALLIAAVIAFAVAASSAQAAAGLRAGAGRADLTPKTGYYLGGWTRADRISAGQQTRLYSRALVLQRGTKKVAIVSIDLFMVPGGMLKQIGDRLKSRGFSEQNILVTASHTHSGPGGYANFPTLNTAAPSLQTATDPQTFANFLNPKPADPELYRFVLESIESAIIRADGDKAPAVAGWGHDRIVGLTQNRSIEAHLANFGIIKARGDGDASQAPGGYPETIDPDVDVLRVDKVVKKKGKKEQRIPIGGYSTFADHGTVTKSSFPYYNADHHGSATRVFEQTLRKSGKVPKSQEIVNVYGNGDEGDMSAGLTHSGPAGSDEVGRTEAAAMLRAWKQAGRAATKTPAFDMRWTRVCFCGQEVEGGHVASQSEVGLPFLTGSEEERGPLFDLTHVAFEDTRSPIDRGDPQGDKAGVVGAGDVPNHVPLMALRIGDRVVVTVPGEPTKEVGTRIKNAVGAAVAGQGIERVVVAGLANEFVLYFTTPEEYDRQHYEGGNTHFGRVSANLIKQELTALAGHLVHGEPAQQPTEFDPTNGVVPDGPAYGAGADKGTIVDQPSRLYERLQRATLAWQGGPQGLDRPVDKPFINAERRDGRKWVHADDDLGMSFLWKVDADGRYEAQWEIPREMPVGVYRLRVSAKRYELISNTFQVDPTGALTVEPVDAGADKFAVKLRYPAAVENQDLTYRPKYAGGGAVIFRIGGQDLRVKSSNGTFTVDAPAGTPVRIEAAAARDRFGNSARAAFDR